MKGTPLFATRSGWPATRCFVAFGALSEMLD